MIGSTSAVRDKQPRAIYRWSALHRKLEMIAVRAGSVGLSLVLHRRKGSTLGAFQAFHAFQAHLFPAIGIGARRRSSTRSVRVRKCRSMPRRGTELTRRGVVSFLSAGRRPPPPSIMMMMMMMIETWQVRCNSPKQPSVYVDGSLGRTPSFPPSGRR